MSGNHNSGRHGPAQVVAAAMLDLLDVAVPALENDYAGQAVLDAIRATHADLARQLQGSRWSPHGRKPPQEPRSSQALQLGGNGVKHAP